MDYGHEQTDKMLKDLEKKIRKEYTQAAREVEASMNKWLANYQKNDDKMRALWKSGEISKKDYTDWRKKQILLSDKWKAQRDELTQRMMEADKVASGLITDHKMEVYALNYNYGTYEVEKGARIDTGFSLYNKDTVARLMKDDPKLLPPPGKKTSDKIRKGELKRWNNKQVQSVMTQGILQGESIPKISKRLAVAVGEKNAYSHYRAARTMTTSAENAGRMDSYKRAEDMGIKMGKTWLAAHDNHTRRTHRIYDGMTIPIKDEFAPNLMFPGDPDADPAEIYNCFVGNTLVATDSDIVRSYKHKYKGNLVTVKTAAGVEFTCTPNHPILTPSGWVRANRLNEGDDICVTFIGDHHLSRRYPNVNHIHPRIDALHEFANKFGRERVSGLRVNFHGDVPATDVEVITHKGLLRDNRNAGEFEGKRKLGFKFSNSTLFSHGTLMKHLRRVGTSAFCFVCGTCDALSFFLRGLRHSEIHRLRPIALLDASGMKPMKNNLSGYAEFFRKRLHGASTVVFADNIISVNYSTDCTHVYNLQSDSGYYFVNSIISKNGGMYNGIGAIVHNCRCTLVADVLSVDGIDLSDIGRGAWEDNWNMDYDEWVHALDKGAEKPKPFDRNNVQYSGVGKQLRSRFEGRGVEYNEVSTWVKQPTEKEIIERLAGGDMTSGSCMSLAYAYAGNKNGLDVIDFRGGQSCDTMSYAHNSMINLPKAKTATLVEMGSTIRPAKALLKQVEPGKEYIFITGRHAAVVRKHNGALQYLEMQSARENGWMDFEREYIAFKGHPVLEKKVKQNMSDTLKNRFGCGSPSAGVSSLTDIECFKDDDEFRDILGYINTAPDKQKKGASGSVK